MKTNSILLAAILILVLSAGLALPARPAQAAPAQSLAVTGVCAFGYTLQSGPAWIEIGNLAPVVFDNPDNSYYPITGPGLPLGFTFNFFEKSYSSLWISTNGFITFSGLSGNGYDTNAPIPSEFLPNNLVAAFWDDLVVGGSYNSGSVYYKPGDSSNPAVVEWKNVTRLGSTDLLTFELVLHPSGDIDFIYQGMNGKLDSATVGIEDAEGADGCQLLYNQAGLGSNQSLTLKRPASSAFRVKAYPIHQGGFLTNGSTLFAFSAVNTSASNDTFSFQPNAAGGWSVSVLDASQKTTPNPLPLAGGGVFSGFIKVSAPAGAVIGDYFNGQLQVISSGDTTKRFTISFDTAVAAPFAAFYVDSSAVKLRFVLPDRQTVAQVYPAFSGTTLALSRLGGWNYLADWEYKLSRPDYQVYGNIQTAVANPGGLKSGVKNLYDNYNTPGVLDRTPDVATTNSGVTGVAFARKAASGIYDIYFAKLDGNGNLVAGPVKLTNNSDLTMSSRHPAIAVLDDTHFLVAFEQKTTSGTTTANDIDGVVVTIANNTITPSAPRKLTDSAKSYFGPCARRMQNGNIFLTYLSQVNDTSPTLVEYGVYASGNYSALTSGAYPAGENPQAAVLIDGTILAAWAQADGLGVQYARFDKASGAMIDTVPGALASIENRAVEYVSVSGDIYGHGVVAWTDSANYYLYYALLRSTANSSPLTPPMAFLRGSDPDTPNLIFSSTGRGIAPLDPFWSTSLPAIMR